jgi:hypothetical protein
MKVFSKKFYFATLEKFEEISYAFLVIILGVGCGNQSANKSERND